MSQEIARSGAARDEGENFWARAATCGGYNRVVDSIEAQGFVLLSAALDEGWIEKLRRAFESAPQQRDGTQHVRIDDATPELAAWRALEQHPAVSAAAARVLARPYRIREVHGRNPLPGFGQQGLHADWPERGPRDPAFALTAIWMLDDFTASNGATRIVPGSHHLRAPIPKSLGLPLAHHPQEQLVTGKAGSVLFISGHLWHSGTQNQSRGPRRAVQMTLVALT
jgi:phytanoyl-CoA dioxygenase PhyH